MNTTYNFININLTAVINDEPIVDVPCKDCTFCCQRLSPYLTPEEIGSGLYPISLLQPTENEIKQQPNIGPKVALFRNYTGGCSMLIDNKCSIYEQRPMACRQFDCRKGHHSDIPDMT